jgi:F-type H+-transporting ATPase subunit gamma
MANTRVLLRRRKAVMNTRKITKTMEKIATAKLAKAKGAATAGRPYADQLRALAAEATRAGGAIPHPLLAAHPKPKRICLIVLTSDRGLCGAFNANIVKAARNLVNAWQAQQREIELIVQGKKGIGAFKHLRLPMTERLIGVSDKPSYARAEAIAQRLIKQYESGTLDEVHVVFSPFRGASYAAPKSEQLLPLTPPVETPQASAAKGAAPAKKPTDGAGCIFLPDAKTILAQLLPLLVTTQLFTAMLENAASEHAARRVAMKNASDSAEDMIRYLTRVYNRARQGKITQEIAEIVGGANAL